MSQSSAALHVIPAATVTHTIAVIRGDVVSDITVHHDDPEMWVSTETIDQSLYVQSRGALRRELTLCLRTGRALRHPGRQPGQRKNRIPAMVNISERPAEATDRAVPGHWEGDLIIGKRNLRSCEEITRAFASSSVFTGLVGGR